MKFLHARLIFVPILYSMVAHKAAFNEGDAVAHHEPAFFLY